MKKANIRNKFSYLVLPDLNGNMRDSDAAISNFKSAFNKTTTVQQYSSAQFSSKAELVQNELQRKPAEMSPADIYRRASNNM